MNHTFGTLILVNLIPAAMNRRPGAKAHNFSKSVTRKRQGDIVINDVAAELARLNSGEGFCLITIHDCLVHDCADRLCIAFKSRMGFDTTAKVKEITDRADSCVPNARANISNLEIERDEHEEIYRPVEELARYIDFKKRESAYWRKRAPRLANSRTDATVIRYRTKRIYRPS